MALKIKRTFRISEVASNRLTALSEQLGMTNSDLIEQMIMDYNSTSSEGGNASAEQLAAIMKKLNAIDRQSYHQLNILNSLAYNLNFSDYENATKNPHDWLRQSSRDYNSDLLANKTAKLIKEQE